MTGNRLIDAIEAKGYSFLDTYTRVDRMWETELHVYLKDTDEEIGIYDSDDGAFIDENYECGDDYDDGYASNMHCDTYGVCGGYNCPNYIKCHA